jgi:uncharacterized membrane protein
MASVCILGILWAAMRHGNSHMFTFVNVWAALIVAVLVLTPAAFVRFKRRARRETQLEAIQVCSMLATVAGTLFSAVGVMMTLNQPHLTGSWMAIGFFTPLYCGVLCC